MVFSLRTIFLFIRGVDQTGRALDEPGKKLTALEKKQRDLARSSYRLMFAGAAFTAFGAMATRALLGTLEHSIRGERVMGDFAETLDRLKKAIGERILDTFGETITGWIDSLDALAENDLFLALTSEGGLALTLTIAKVGIALTAVSLINQLALGFAGILTAAGYTGAAAAVTGAAGTFLSIALPVILTLIVGQIIWSFLPKDTREQLMQKAREFASSIQFGKYDIANIEGMEGGNKTTTLQPQLPTLKDFIINIQNFFENINTTADVDELGGLISESTVDGVEQASGAWMEGEQ